MYLTVGARYRLCLIFFSLSPWALVSVTWIPSSYLGLHLLPWGTILFLEMQSRPKGSSLLCCTPVTLIRRFFLVFLARLSITSFPSQPVSSASHPSRLLGFRLAARAAVSLTFSSLLQKLVPLHHPCAPTPSAPLWLPRLAW